MYVTVAEAILVVCPMSRNRVNMPDQVCLANGCMVWRWSTAEAPDKGYCGLAAPGVWPQGTAGPT